MRVLYIITGLQTGGAERQLGRLLACLHGGRIDAAVVSLAPRGPVSSEIESLGVPVWHLGLDQPWRLPWAAARLVSIAKRFRPDVIQGWMYHGNLAASIAGRVLDRPVVWGVRQSLYDLKRERPGTRAVIRLSARWSNRVAGIVYNAALSRTQHEAFGFARESGWVIGNGFDGREWCPDAAARASVRAELGIAPDAPLIGLIARYHPMKGHEIFLDAAARLALARPDVHFLLAGREVTPAHPLFAAHCHNKPLAGRLHLLGERADIPRLNAALDIASSSSSWGEAFSNALAEALLCGVPVAATDVGDARIIVGDAGIVVPRGDACALANAWQALLDSGFEARQAMGRAGRERLLAVYSVEAVAQAYARLYEKIQDRWTKT
ncbi:glycosyltransferase [Pelomicrobium methylotrophicum]|uniref:Glycosyltransferase n=1 Tax=Pelomicrobium methylotrophicum TaxID=2602750 RepID=A0A5C7EYD1_9PROT|nr:glycosyltransferase [Pelomicrobium methylotrophicum]TXF13347.1 glycosyltransferase [Pelomicrobium methylotrophicum]